MLLFLGGILGGLLIAGTIPVWRWFQAGKGEENRHPGVVGPVVATWFLLAFCFGPWLVGRAVIGLVKLFT